MAMLAMMTGVTVSLEPVFWGLLGTLGACWVGLVLMTVAPRRHRDGTA